MDERSRRVERWFSVPVIAAAVLVIPLLVIQETSDTGTLRTVATVLNWTTWAVFAAELVAMLWVVPRKREWLRTHPIEVAVVVLTPPVLPPGLQSLRVLRLLRLLRLLPLLRASRELFSLQGLGYAAFLAVLTAAGGGVAFEAVEGDRGLSGWDGIYWAVTTMTTVGSDIYPTTTGGRVIAMTIVLIGISFVALLTGAIAERFLGPEIEEEVGELEEEAATEAELVVRELREITGRLRRLEGDVERLAQAERRDAT